MMAPSKEVSIDPETLEFSLLSPKKATSRITSHPAKTQVRT